MVTVLIVRDMGGAETSTEAAVMSTDKKQWTLTPDSGRVYVQFLRQK